jgi:hypothetical protein
MHMDDYAIRVRYPGTNWVKLPPKPNRAEAIESAKAFVKYLTENRASDWLVEVLDPSGEPIWASERTSQ